MGRARQAQWNRVRLYTDVRPQTLPEPTQIEVS